MKSNEPYSDEGFSLMGAAFAVHNEMGGGLSEEIYQECLELELGSKSIPFESQVSLPVFYKGEKLEKSYIPDIIAYSEIIVELKAVTKLLTEHEAQLMNYMRITRKPVGYLINFGPTEAVEWKRFIIKEFLTQALI